MMFITFEGVDGAGLTTQLFNLATHLRGRGFDVLTTSEPDAELEGSSLFSRDKMSDGHDPMQDLIIFSSGRARHVERIIRPALNEGSIVISDRYIHSTLAYQGLPGGVERKHIIDLFNETTGSLWPNLTFIIDVDPAKSLPRSREYSRYGADGVEMLNQVRQTYKDEALCRPDKIFIIDGDRETDHISKDILKIIKQFLPEAG